MADDPTEQGGEKARYRYPPNPRLAQARIERRLTQEKLAERLAARLSAVGDDGGLDPNSVGRWERGERRPKLKFYPHLVAELNKSEEELGLVPEAELLAEDDSLDTGPEDEEAPYIELVGSGGVRPLSQPSPGRAPHDVRRYARVAVVAALVACAWGGLAIFQVGPYAKTEIIVEGTVPRPSADEHPEAKSPVQATHCPVASSPFTKGPQMELMIQLATTTPACWTAELSPVNPGTTIRYLITYFNSSNKLEDNVVISTKLPPGVMLIPNTTKIFNSDYPHGTPDGANNVATGGINIGNYDPAAGGYVDFEAAIPRAGGFACYWNEDRTVGIGQVWGPGDALNTHQIWHKGNQFYNTATLDIYKAC